MGGRVVTAAQRAAWRRGSTLALALALGAADALAWCRTTTLSPQTDPLVCPAAGLAVAWPYGCASVHLDPRLPAVGAVALDDLRRVTAASLDAWASAVCDAASDLHPGFRLRLLGDLAVPVGYAEGGANANTVVLRDRWEGDAFHAPDAAALTVVTFNHDTGAILDADLELNVRGPDNPRGMIFTLGDGAGVDLQSTLTHELGHAQGLAHSADGDAVMWALLGRGEQRRAPTADDALGLCVAYPPRDVSRCDPSLNGLRLHGRGAACGVGPRPGSRPAVAWAVVGLAALALAGARRSTRRPRARRPTPTR